MRKIIFIIFLLNFSLLLDSCATAAQKETAKQELLEPQMELKFGDIPVPAGFKLLPEESYSFQAAGIRVGILRYRGKADVEQVVNFYKEQMAIYNWALLNVSEHGDRLLNFDRESESCIISLTAKGNNITINIAVGPKAKEIPNQNRPVK